MKYRSTRGGSTGLSFEDALFQGLSPDGGLYIPETIPILSSSQIASWANLPFHQLAFQILRLFIDVNEIPDNDLLSLLERSFSTFSNKDVVPLCPLTKLHSGDKNNVSISLNILELFHGPTFAFKDVALQVVGNMFEYFLKKRNSKSNGIFTGQTGTSQTTQPNGFISFPYHINVLGATSGDTGGAAIYGLKGKENISVFILHPKDRISNIQEAQMTSVLDENIHNIAIEGTFDDCQEIVKLTFGDENFRNKHHLAAVNSINWARILAQTTYYFSSFLTLLKKRNALESFSKTGVAPEIIYSVPSGNFGDVLAGYYAVRMGLPISRLVIATNENDILHRFMKSGSYRKQTGSKVKATLSPAMDILVSSNFERLAWYLVRGDGRTSSNHADLHDEINASEVIKQWMLDLRSTGGFDASPEVLERAKEVFDSVRVTDEKTTDTIKEFYHYQYYSMSLNSSSSSSSSSQPYILDPHTAVGVAAAIEISKSITSSEVDIVCLSTAHPGKFPDAIFHAINDLSPPQAKENGFRPLTYSDIAPKELVALQGLPKRCKEINNDHNLEKGVEEVKAFIELKSSQLNKKL